MRETPTIEEEDTTKTEDIKRQLFDDPGLTESA